MSFVYGPSRTVALVALILLMGLLVRFSRRVARGLIGFTAVRGLPGRASAGETLLRFMLCGWAVAVSGYSLLWLLGLVNPDG